MTALTREQIENALNQNRVWDLGNQVLYDLCFNHPRHQTHEEIIAKIWLIGRSYSAAIERRKNNLEESFFYEKTVAPKIKDSEIDLWFEAVRNNPTSEKAIETHGKLTSLFEDISGLEKRSLASKYLHFHFKDLFFIYDSRAAKAISMITERFQRVSLNVCENDADQAYKAYFERCLAFQRDLESLLGRKPSPREIDKIFLFVADMAQKKSLSV